MKVFLCLQYRVLQGGVQTMEQEEMRKNQDQTATTTS